MGTPTTTKRYVVFERVKGSRCWTVAMTSRSHAGYPTDFFTRAGAETWVQEVHSKRRGWWHGKPNARPMEAHIAEVELPG